MRMASKREYLSNLVQDFFVRVESRLQDFSDKYICFELRHGANLPAGYGWAGYNKITERVYVLPIGINYLYSLTRWFYFEIAEGIQSRAESYTYKTGRQLGQLAGEQRGYQLGYIDAKNGKPNAVLEALKKKGVQIPDAPALPDEAEDDNEEAAD